MPCSTIYEFLKSESGRFDGEMYRIMFPRSFWIAATKKGPWLDGYGKTLSSITFKPRAPGLYATAESGTTPGEWLPFFKSTSNSVINGAAGMGSCAPPRCSVMVGSETVTYKPYVYAMRGPDFCLTDIRYTYQAAEQLTNIVNVLSDYATIEWEFRYRHEFLRLSRLKVVVGAAQCYEAVGDSFDDVAQCPGSRLTQGVLDKYKLYLMRRGGLTSTVARVNGMGVLTLVCEPEVSDDLITQNSDMRQDIRYAEPSMLLQAIGHDGRVYKGFIHVLDPYPIRYTCDQGVYTEVATFSDLAIGTTNSCSDTDCGGDYVCESTVNSSWETAPYTTSHIWDSDVFHSLIPPTLTNVGPLNFNAINYTTGAGANLELLNIIDRDCNPRGDIVYHDGILASASKPVRPDKGVSIAHLRCDPALNLITACS